ncbi:NAD(P)-binding protein [Eremomyces bilateralis CBS 781.70]|uniref:NAD(P)-binding protein n=1 Tax=Eremomyces bilateralis CBS 781.70 TaxID=1392243 RepID=A0A6G1FTU8_9PEZI|nr:NAD(P)-binding protein [Eremomyces bilateralis CBS 781.70]KAF1809091.1 NAD(P)-binding protein [Eremomyces bilateralis CBS 781.70]
MVYEYWTAKKIDNSVPADLSKLKGRSVIVTGVGSSGLGAGYVQGFLDAGAYVTNLDLNPNKDQEGKSNYQFYRADATNWSQQLKGFKAAADNSPSKSIDIVVANAGIAIYDDLFQLDDADEPAKPELKVLHVNIIGVSYTVKLARHYFNKEDASRDKVLILKASLAGYLDLPGATQYNAYKFGVRGFLCNLRKSDLSRVNLLAPWFIPTPIIPDTVKPLMEANLKRLGSEFAHVEDAVKACLRLAALPPMIA